MDSDRPEPSNRSAGDLPRVLDHRVQLGERLARAESVLLCLDFDGTLAPIVDEPMLAMLPAAMRQTLNELAALENVTIAIVSGRALGDVKGRVGMPGLIYAGNHGLEIEGPGLSFEHPVAAGLKAKSAPRHRAGRGQGCVARWSRDRVERFELVSPLPAVEPRGPDRARIGGQRDRCRRRPGYRDHGRKDGS